MLVYILEVYHALSRAFKFEQNCMTDYTHANAPYQTIKPQSITKIYFTELEIHQLCNS